MEPGIEPPGGGRRHLGRQRDVRTFEGRWAALLGRTLPGATRLTVADALGPGRGPFRGRWLGQDIADVLQFLRQQAARSPDVKWLVHASPGVGKSLLATALALPPAQQGPTGAETVRGGLLVELSPMLTAVPQFGSESWLSTVVGAQQGPQGSGILVLDALDELFPATPLGDLPELLARRAFAVAHVVTCRTSFYGRHLRETRFARSRQVIELMPWSDDDVADVAQRYFTLLARGEDTRGRFFRLWSAFESFRRLCRSPLNLSMAVSTLADHPDSLSGGEVGLLELYEAWIEGVLLIESARPGSVLDAASKSRLLENLAWMNYDLSEQGETVPYGMERVEYWLTGAMAAWREERGLDVQSVMADLLEHSVLMVTPQGGVLSPQYAFRHRTLQDFYVGLSAFHSLSGRSGKSPTDVFRTYLGPDVWVFLQLMLWRAVANDRPTVNRIARNGLAALDRAADEALLDDAPPSARILREQLGHYLGHLDVRELAGRLRRHIALETDPWVRRGTAIGLSFGGDTGALDDYVNILRAERETSDPQTENITNRGAHLSFYGDQPYREEVSEHDLGLPSCERTLERLVSQLKDPLRWQSRRLDLYSLLDIAVHRPESLDRGRVVLRSRIDDLRDIVGRLATRTPSSEWPEVAELRETIRTIAQQS